MGIRGLQSFIENNYPQVLEWVEFSTCADEYRKQTNLVPVLIIDGYSCGAHFYKNLRSDILHIGHYKEFGEYLMHIVSSLTASGIKCLFFFDGSPCLSREEIWIERRNKEGQKISDIFEFIKTGQLVDAKLLLRDFVACGEFMKHTLRANKCNITSTVEQADDEIIDYIARNGCFGVLAQDTDYIIMEGVLNYFSAMHLDPSGTKTKVYRRQRLALELGIDEALLPLFATLSGNDITSDEDLRVFHLLLLRDHYHGYRFQRARFLPKREIIPRVVNWIHQKLNGCKNPLESAKIVPQILQMPNLEQKIAESVKSYLLPDVSQERKTVPSNDAWGEILKVAEDRHRKEGQHRILLAILTSLKFHQGSYCELFSHVSYVHSSFLHRVLRRRLYGILLKERPKELGEASVKEYICSSTEIRPKLVSPEFPNDHPGLLRLWRDPQCTELEKLNIFSWAVSESIQSKTLSLLPRDLRLASVTIYFLTNEVKSGLLPWQVQTLVALIVRLSNTSLQEIQKINCGNQDIIEIHIGSLYMRTWFNILAVDDACGNPLYSGPGMVFFDGKLFHDLYKFAKRGTPARSLCDSSLFDVINGFLNKI